MKNYRRHSGDGSAKVVLSGDSNSPFKTTPRREPLPYNSSSAEELCPFAGCASRVGVEAPLVPQCRRLRCHTLPSLLFPTPDHRKSVTLPGISHLISPKTPVISPFSSNLTSTSHQKVGFLPGDSAFGNSPAITFWSLVLAPSRLLYLLEMIFPSCSLCEFGLSSIASAKEDGFMVDRSSDQNPSKKPVNPPKFTFQHSPQTACFGVSVVKFVQLRSVDSAPSVPSAKNPTQPTPSHQNSQKTPDIPAIPPNPTCSSHQKVDSLPSDLAVGNALVISAWKLDFRGCGVFVVKALFHPPQNVDFAPPPPFSPFLMFKIHSKKPVSSR
jgi:hypothetical protein